MNFKWLRISFVLAVLLHLLFLFSIAIHLSVAPIKEKVPPPSFVPAYVYSGAVTPPTPPSLPLLTRKASHAAAKPPSDAIPTRSTLSQSDPWGYGTGSSTSTDTTPNESLSENQMEQAIQEAKSREPMLLVGDESGAPDPLVKMIGRSLSTHFRYPREEGSFGIRGRVLVEMILHPDGKFTNVRIIQSSDNQDFDSAALYAVNMAPPVLGASRMLTKPKYMIIGFIFG